MNSWQLINLIFIKLKDNIPCCVKEQIKIEQQVLKKVIKIKIIIFNLNHEINLFHIIISLNKFNEGGEEKFEEQIKNHHNVNEGIKFIIPLLINKFRE